MAFRSGWNISTGSLVANILLAVTIIPIGIIFFREDFSLMKVAGAALCIFGLVLINW
jgi:multidrug transporter EmrE-like cation transporter